LKISRTSQLQDKPNRYGDDSRNYADHIAGVRRFELPLRGESLAAWSNSWFVRSPSGQEPQC
jgi:hypothetical protein